ncbi:DNA/RNA non-specific endonuclease [Paracoccus sp. 08]|uniref:DNA/RNA non-specific endonuclease n=1 Tax=Paracoccus sp. 08 TaxID=2606624 RepID=UPI0020949895|nr:DNA/RNA non-specific endonuclease [Paracoccus sp. 08]MCO6364368.1 DNA/RNA non-specific endonuclease [Paracoccus sp. 08]
MGADLNYRPRLSDMHLLVEATANSSTEAVLETSLKKPRITRAETLIDRKGYDSDFLGDLVVPLPIPAGNQANDVLEVEGSDGGRLDYTNFSVVMSRSRKIAMFVAVNIDGSTSRSIERGSDKWFLDGRIPIDAQVGEELYADNLLDRGHLVRREDPNWGPDAEIANDDTFHFTNCAPQMGAFNQRTWLSLEDYVLKNTRRWRERVTVFTGPVLRDDDRLYRHVQIPTAFWKVIAFVSEAGRPVNGGVKTGHAAAQNQASGEAPSAMARALPK